MMTRDPKPLNVVLDLTAEVERLNAQNRQLRQQVNGLRDELAAAERQVLEWQAALHHAETEARQAGFTGSIREPGPALLAILQERDEARAQAARLAEALRKLRQYIIDVSHFSGGTRILWPDQIQSIDAALASTDSRAWLNEQIAAELESVQQIVEAEEELDGDPPAEVSQYFADVPTAVRCLRVAVRGAKNSIATKVRKRIAELRRKESK